MKKSKVAIGVLVVLGAAWVGGAWFTGKTAETQYLKQIDQFNQQFQTWGLKALNVEVKNKQFDRGIFSSQIEDEVVITSEEKQWVIPLSTKIYHGPLPLNQLAKFNIMPAMYAAEGFIGKNETTQPLFDLIHTDKPLQYQASTGYGLTTKGAIELAAGQAKDPELAKNQLSWSDIALNFEVNKNLAGSYGFKAAEITADLSDEDKADSRLEAMKWQWKGINYQGTFEPTKWNYLQTGKSTTSIDSVEMSMLDKDGTSTKVEEKGVKGSADLSLDGDFLSYKAQNTIDLLRLNEQDLGKVTYNAEFNHIDANAINAFIEMFIYSIKTAQDGDKLAGKRAFDVWLAQYGMAILNHQPQIKLNLIEIADNQGKLLLDLNVALAKNPKFDVLRGNLYKQFTDFSVNIALDKATAENLLNKLSGEENNPEIHTKVEAMAAEAENNGFAVNGEKTVSMKLALENGELKLNGEVIPEDQVQGILFMLLMGAALQH